MESPWHYVTRETVTTMTTFTLRLAITLVALLIIWLAWRVKSKWTLGGIFAYEVLP